MHRVDRRVQFACGLEFGDGFLWVIGLEQRGELVVGDRLIGRELHHLTELRDGRFVIALLLVKNSEVKPGVRERRIVLLDFFEENHALVCLTGVHQREAVVEFFAIGVGGEVESFFKFGGGFGGSGRVFVKRFAEIAALFDALGHS